ncbi:hypothetical protein F5I97DRAFT_1788563, partial [Phlebopus sp. FC_14]
RQVNIDYALVNALQYNMNGIQWVLTFYDINCQYMKNLHKQIRDSTYLKLNSQLSFISSIGIWHVHGHQVECFARYTPNFISRAGWVDGEIIETLWSTINIISGIVRGMSSPHQQEYLDSQMNYSNFLKMI